MTGFWTIVEAAKAWNVSESRARILAKRVPGSSRAIKHAQLIWVIPEGSPKPECLPHGRPRKDKKP